VVSAQQYRQYYNGQVTIRVGGGILVWNALLA
jgi:hypothetical protein